MRGVDYVAHVKAKLTSKLGDLIAQSADAALLEEDRATAALLIDQLFAYYDSRRTSLLRTEKHVATRTRRVNSKVCNAVRQLCLLYDL